MDISTLTFIDKLHLFLRPRITIIWYILLAAAWIPFFFTDIEWKPLLEVRLDDDMGAFLTMQAISWLYFFLLLWLHCRRISRLRGAQLTRGKAKPNPEAMAFVRGLQKAYRMNGVYTIDGRHYPIISGLVTQVDFDKVYEFPVMYDPRQPEKGRVLTELPRGIADKLADANGYGVA